MHLTSATCVLRASNPVSYIWITYNCVVSLGIFGTVDKLKLEQFTIRSGYSRPCTAKVEHLHDPTQSWANEYSGINAKNMAKLLQNPIQNPLAMIWISEPVQMQILCDVQ